jgi:hypothetical protein
MISGLWHTTYSRKTDLALVRHIWVGNMPICLIYTYMLYIFTRTCSSNNVRKKSMMLMSRMAVAYKNIHVADTGVTSQMLLKLMR